MPETRAFVLTTHCRRTTMVVADSVEGKLALPLADTSVRKVYQANNTRGAW